MLPSEKLAAELIAMLDDAAARTGKAQSSFGTWLNLGGNFYARLKKSGKYRGSADTVERIRSELPALITMKGVG